MTVADFTEYKFPQPDYQFDLSTIPAETTVLKLGNRFKQPIRRGELPQGLKKLTLPNLYDHELEIGSLPEGLEELIFGREYCKDIRPGVLPKSLKILRVLGGHFDGKVIGLVTGSLPEGLEEFYFTCNSTYKIQPSILPRSLKIFHMTGYFNNVLVMNSLPDSLEELRIDIDSQCIYPGLFPSSIKILSIPRKIKDKLEPDVLPENLQVLDLTNCDRYKHEFQQNLFPKNLKKLYLPRNYNGQIRPNVIPDNLEEIHIHPKYSGTYEFIPKTTRIYSHEKHIPGRNYTLVYRTGDTGEWSEKMEGICQHGEPYEYHFGCVRRFAVDVSPLRCAGSDSDNAELIRKISEQISQLSKMLQNLA